MKRSNTPYLILLLISIMIIFSACQGGQANSAARKVPTPASGKAIVTGRVLDPAGQPYKNTPVRLAAIYRQGDQGQGAFVLDLASSPGAFSDQNGYFVIEDVSPNEYTIVVGDPDKKYRITADDKGQAKTWKAESGKILDVGTLTLDLNKSQ